MEAKIIFRDGTEITAEKNGDCCITDQKPAFPSDLRGLIIRAGTEEKTFDQPALVECASVDGRYWFSFVEPDPRDTEIRMLEDAILELAEMIGG